MKKKLQIFVSSTYTDLIEERQAAVSAILKSGHIPAGMELFTAADRSQMATITQWIDESDVYMLILGGRYGSIEKESGLSYTELEYDYAVLNNKPIFAVVIQEEALEKKVTTLGTAFMEKVNPKELGLFRSKVLSNVCSFFDDIKDVKLCIHESLADFSSNRELKGWVSAAEIPDTQPLFEEITKLSDENKALRRTLAELEKKKIPVESIQPMEHKFAELSNVLSAIEVKIPSSASRNGEDITVSLLSVFYQMKEPLINGVRNSANASSTEIFLYSNICPKLQIHGLIDNEKVTGVQWRRSVVSSFGKEFLAYIERSILGKKRNEVGELILPISATAKDLV